MQKILANPSSVDSGDWFLGSEDFFEDLALVKIHAFSTWENPKELGDVYQVKDTWVTYNQNFLYASQKEKKGSESVGFILVQEKKGDPWSVYSVGEA